MQKGRPRRRVVTSREAAASDTTQDRPLHSLDGFELQTGTPRWLNGAHHASHGYGLCVSYTVVSCCCHRNTR